jgi:pimeloyl-ACP methyl ester carboxylesterase
MRVIYLHGFASSPASRKARFFSAKFEALDVEFEAPELDEGDFRNLRISSQLRLVESLLQEPEAASTRSASETILIGSSLGGYLAALLAARLPLRIHRLILLAPAFNLYQRWTTELGPERLTAWENAGEVLVYHYGAGCQAPIGYQFVAEAAQYQPFPSFQQDALIFHGALDTVVPIAFSETFAVSHPNIRLFRLQSGHELTDVVDEIWKETEEFLSKPYGSSAAPSREPDGVKNVRV